MIQLLGGKLKCYDNKNRKKTPKYVGFGIPIIQKILKHFSDIHFIKHKPLISEE